VEFEFLEQYNEKILVKYKGQNLQIIDILTHQVTEVNDFETPEAFIFIYEKEVFLSLKDGRIILYSINGDMLSNFDGQSVYSIESMNNDVTRKVYQLCLSDTRNKVLTIVKDKFLQRDERENNRKSLDD
jgi:hypothetical protein|tara:strand:- start:44 stop:430 length:387 start_codon:yes stop_codon:yes gene_type:complete